MVGKKHEGGVAYQAAGLGYFEDRELRRHAGVFYLWALGVAAVISGDFSGWNLGIAVGGWGGMFCGAVIITIMYLGLTYSIAEMSPALPHTGGAYSFARTAFGPWGGFITTFFDKTFREFTLETNDRLKNFTDPANVPALKNISSTLTKILKKYYADSDLIATWEPITEFPISFPSSQIEVKDHGFQCGVARVGHGLQRAIIITILEFLASERLRDIDGQEENFEIPHSDIIVAIEEPEIYQHPIKQRHITDVLAQITESFNKQTGIRIQVLLATHSPLFVRLPRFQEVRISCRGAEAPNQVRFSKLTLSECSAGLANLHEPPKEPMKDNALAAKLHVFTADLSEGFFGTKVVLVEGLSDKAVLEASLAVRGRTATSEGLTILAVGGKKILDKPAFIFRALGIPTYVVFDNDQSSVKDDQKDSEIYYNRFMQRLLGVLAEDLEDWPSGVHKEWAAWDGNLEKYLVEKCSAELYGKVKIEMMAHFEVSNDDCVKSPTIAGAMLTSFIKHDIVFDELDQIIDTIDAL